MSPSQHLIDFLKKEEGYILHPYLDQAGVPTVGIGTTHYPNGTAVKITDAPITATQAMQFVLSDLKDISLAVNKATKDVPLSQNQFDALISLTYNIGVVGFKGSTVLRLIRKNPQDPQISNAFGLWDKLHKNGKLVTSDTLTGRRRREAKLYFSP